MDAVDGSGGGASAVPGLAEAVDAVGGVVWASVPDDDLRAALGSLERTSRRLDAALAEATAELAQRLRRSGRSAGSAASLCAEASGSTTGEARRRAEAGARSATPAMRALAEGRISAGQERVIAEHLAELPDDAAAPVRDVLADTLVELAAAGSSARALAARARHELAEADPSRLDRVEERQQRRRGLRCHRPDTDGVALLAVTADPRLQALVDAVVARHGAPGRCLGAPVGGSPSDPHTVHHPGPAEVAAADTRTPEQRAHDALCHVLALGLEADPARARGVASIVVRVTAEQMSEITSGGGLVETDAGTQLSTRQAVSMAGSRAWFVSALCDGQEELHRVDVDRRPRARLASTLQRLVLFAAHGGCTFPGCERPSAQCQAHHVVEWARGGPTTVANLADACPTHHGRVGTGPDSWRTEPEPGRPGRPRWLPPERRRQRWTPPGTPSAQGTGGSVNSGTAAPAPPVPHTPPAAGAPTVPRADTVPRTATPARQSDTPPAEPRPTGPPHAGGRAA